MATGNKQNINIGIQSNDGTGDSIRDAFRKTNENFQVLFDAAGLDNGLRFTELADAPQQLNGQQIIVTVPDTDLSDPTNVTLTQVSLVGGQGIGIDYNYAAGKWTINNTTSSLATDPAPFLSANLSGTSTFRAVKFADPIADQDLVTRKFLYDNFLNRDGTYRSGTETNTSTFTSVTTGSTLRTNIHLLTTATTSTHLVNKEYADRKISLAGVDTIDPATGSVNTSSGVMTGPLILSRDPITSDDIDYEGMIAATKKYVDSNDFFSSNNLFITTKGRDYQPDVPAERRGRSWAHAFRSLNEAAQYAEALIATSQIQVGDYARLITYDNGTAATVAAVGARDANNLVFLDLDVGLQGSDQIGTVETGRYTIFPGQYVQGVDSFAIGLIQQITKADSPGDVERYTIEYIDYGDDFATDITTSIPDVINFPNRVKMTFDQDKMVPIPEFWIGYEFYTDSGVPNGIIVSATSEIDSRGVYYGSFIVEFEPGSAPPPGQTFLADDWHVYSGDFIPGETVVYNTNVSALQISFMMESGEYNEQHPIKLPNNTSIRGDEFRRVIIRPTRGISSSPWANTYFRRDAQIDGLQTVALDTTTNYASAGTLNGSAVLPSGSSGYATFSLSQGSFPEARLGYMFVGNGGQGVIVSSSEAGFTVNLGTPLINVNEIAAGDWYIYRPFNYGYHYLRDASRPINVFIEQANPGGLVNAAALIKDNRAGLQAEVISFLNSEYPGLVYDQAKYSRDIGIVIDGLIYDITYGSWNKTINAGDAYVVAPGQQVETVAAVEHLGFSLQDLINANPVEPTAGIVIADLIQACSKIINNDPAYNPPKNNADMDVFLCNDANVIRYVSCQGHGGFMMVLDPDGQIKNKSPYCQTASSFSQSIAKQRFAGGMFVDGFAGNVLARPLTTTFTNPVQLPVKGLVRRPQVPTFFNIKGVRYEVSFFADYQPDPDAPGTYTATLYLNPLVPGGIPNTVEVNDTVGGFSTSTNYIPITIQQPTGVGGVVATGYAVSDSSGKITDIVIDFPGTGYIETPQITVGGAIINNLTIFNGVVTNASLVTGGAGYAVGTLIKFSPQYQATTTAATGIVTAVDENGAITAFSITGGGTNWDPLNTDYLVEFGNLSIGVPASVSGFIGSVELDENGEPTPIELITAGNRSMLANDYTQVNDLGYGILCTNGGLAEDVSMFTYYCYRAYYSCNGAQIRSTTGSCGYGIYALTAEGSDPNEVPTKVTLSSPLVQVATAYVNNPLFPAQADQAYIYVTIDPLNGGYPPLNGSQVEINHDGIIRNYSVGSAAPALNSQNQLITNTYQLFFNAGNIATTSEGTGLLTDVPNGAPVIIRSETLFRFTGLDPSTIGRPSTSLVMDDDTTQIYPITGFSTVQPDGSVLIYTLDDYNYITFQARDQGVVTPTLIFGGSEYSSNDTTITIATANLVSGITRTVNGEQGVGTIGIQILNMTSTAGILVGHLVTGASILPDTVVTYVNTTTNKIALNLPTAGFIADQVALTFTATPPIARAIVNSGTVTDIIIDEGGIGWNSTTTNIFITGAGVDARVKSPVDIAGVIGSRTVKISTLDITSENRIQAGLVRNPPRYYQFAHDTQVYKITAYRSPTDLGQSWAEIDLDRPLVRSMAKGTVLRAGVQVSSGGEVTSKISTMRATGHDFLNIGTGGYATSRYPNDLYGPPLLAISQSQEITEINKGRVYYMSTDQDGNFRVGKALTVNQAQGSVSISVPLDLSNLSAISLRRDLGPPINEFSIDNTMITEADYKVPTEQAVVNYINRRLGLDRNGAIYQGSPLGPQFVARDGSLVMTGPLNMGENIIYNVSTPRAGGDGASDAANKDYVDTKIANDGTAAVDVNGITRRPQFGNMTGSLQLYRDPEVKTAVVATTATIGATELFFESLSSDTYEQGDFFQHQANGAGIPAGTIVSAIGQVSVSLGLSTAITSAIEPGTVISFDPVVQASTKRYVDKNKQLSKLVDVALTATEDKDFLMFNSTVIPVNTTTNPPIYESTRQVVNVSNNTATIVNTPTSLGGGSDITVDRSTGLATFKLVGGQGSNNPITDYQVNDDAQIAQSKLFLTAATTSASPPIGTQRQIQTSLGSAQFDNVMFTANNGWVSLRTATSIANGIKTEKMAYIPAGGGLLGATNTAAATSATYVSSSSIKTWLGNEATAWSFAGDLIPNEDGVQRLGTSARRWQNLFISSTATVDGGLVLNTLARISTNQTTAEIFTSTVTTLNIGSTDATTLNLGNAATTVRLGGTSGTLTVGNPIVVGTQLSQDLFNSVATTLNIGSAATTVRLGGTLGTLTVGNPIVVGTQPSQDLFNSVATTVNAFGAAATLNIGNASGTNLIRGTTTLNTLAAAVGGSTVTGNWTLDPGATFQATYADLAEWYSADTEYEPGTVLVFGGDRELTTTAKINDTRVAGPVTTNPAYTLNAAQKGTRACIALQGRVPVKVVGTIKKGDLLTTSTIPGYACHAVNPQVGTIIGKALEDKAFEEGGIIEVAIGRN